MATKTKSAKATREEKLAALRFLWERGNAATLAELWSMQDGYGVPGFMPEQGYDWSGVARVGGEPCGARFPKS